MAVPAPSPASRLPQGSVVYLWEPACRRWGYHSPQGIPNHCGSASEMNGT